MQLSIKIYNIWIRTPCKCKTRMDGKTVIVTGSNTGIGKETACDFARRGAKVILACRNLDKAKEACEDIIESTGNTKVSIRHLDLSSLSSVRAFAKGIIESESRLDVLVNNAGLGVYKRTLTADNLEMTMQVNHLGPFLLTCLLLDLLKKSAPSRIVMVSSWLHNIAWVDTDNFQGEKWYYWIQQYSMSKLANILMTKYMTKKLEGIGVTINCLHPGFILTDIWKMFNEISPILYTLSVFILKIFSKDVVEGAQTTIHVAVAEELEGVSGKYFWECKEATPSKAARNETLTKKLMEESELLVDLKPEERYY